MVENQRTLSRASGSGGSPIAGVSMEVSSETVIRSDPAALCMNAYIGIWRPVKLVLTQERLLCQQGPRTLSSIPLNAIVRVEVAKWRTILRLRRKCLLVDYGRARRLICVRNADEWRRLLFQLRRDPKQQISEGIGGIAN